MNGIKNLTVILLSLGNLFTQELIARPECENFKNRGCSTANFLVKQPAANVSLSNISLSGLQNINGITTGANNRVLLVAQTNAIENGLWLSQRGSWIRPSDFADGTAAAVHLYK